MIELKRTVDAAVTDCDYDEQDWSTSVMARWKRCEIRRSKHQ